MHAADHSQDENDPLTGVQLIGDRAGQNAAQDADGSGDAAQGAGSSFLQTAYGYEVVGQELIGSLEGDGAKSYLQGDQPNGLVRHDIAEPCRGLFVADGCLGGADGFFQQCPYHKADEGEDRGKYPGALPAAALGNTGEYVIGHDRGDGHICHENAIALPRFSGENAWLMTLGPTKPMSTWPMPSITRPESAATGR